jgi:hypothetical protein
MMKRTTHNKYVQSKCEQPHESFKSSAWISIEKYFANRSYFPSIISDKLGKVDACKLGFKFFDYL